MVNAVRRGIVLIYISNARFVAEYSIQLSYECVMLVLTFLSLALS